MIGRLRGQLAGQEEDQALIDVGGVGYVIFASARTLSRLPATGDVTVEIVTQVREDAITLFGFSDKSEKARFQQLMTVQGVGAKVALAILGVLEPDAVAHAIATGDKTAITRANGVGPKLAQRIINELKDKIGQVPMAGPVSSAPVVAQSGGPAADAVSALVNLGYRPADADRAIGRVQAVHGDDLMLSELIRRGLRELAS